MVFGGPGGWREVGGNSLSAPRSCSVCALSGKATGEGGSTRRTSELDSNLDVWALGHDVTGQSSQRHTLQDVKDGYV